VIHVASPFPAENPRDEMEVIGPAVEGTKNVLEACAKTKGGVKRVVLTSSCAAIYGKKASESHMNLRQFTLRRGKLKRPLSTLKAGFTSDGVVFGVGSRSGRTNKSQGLESSVVIGLFFRFCFRLSDNPVFTRSVGLIFTRSYSVLRF